MQPLALSKSEACSFAHRPRRTQITAFMSKGERISQFVQSLEGGRSRTKSGRIADHPSYRAFFHCWNEQQYYEAHDVLEQVWLEKATTSDDAQYFKGLIQAAGAFVHLQKQFEHPTHPKHGRRLRPAVRLLRLAEANLALFGSRRHDFDLETFREMLAQHVGSIVQSDYKVNPWSPKTAPRVRLLSS